MKTFREILADEYAENPDRIGGLADRACRLVRVRRSRWRGQRIVRGAAVVVDDQVVADKTVSEPRWKLLPDRLRKEFGTLEAEVSGVLRAYCVGGGHDEDASADDMKALVGNGVFVTDTLAWPRLKTLLDAAVERWGRAADEICSDEGYERLLGEIRDRFGDALFPKVRAFVPERHQLRTKFGLGYELLPVRLAPDVGRDRPDPGAAEGRRAVVLEALEAAIRGPRERLAAACEQFAAVLTAVGEDGVLRPKQLRRRDGTPVARAVRRDSVRTIVNAVLAFSAFGRYTDPVLGDALAAFGVVLPVDPAAATECCRRLSESDADAVAASASALKVAAAARDEAGMAAGLARALAY